MSAYRQVARMHQGRHTSDGAGVRLTRMFSNNEAVEMDPFLLLDLFGSNRAEDYSTCWSKKAHDLNRGMNCA